ncbi:hypothetical protein HYR99_21690 [Candidatus Poribacteria bacterium]|nr:hypothetical protein [Candidatus Poribacteria bacterium]
MATNYATLSSRSPPAELDVLDLADGIIDLLRRSNGTDKEWGACIVCQDPSSALELTHEIEGTKDGVSPVCSPSDPDHHNYVGFCHIHRTFDDDGSEQVGFSDRDFAATAYDGDFLALVHSERRLYALVRTTQAPPPGSVTQADCDDYLAIFKDYDKLVDGGVLSRQEALWLANVKLCQQLGYALYVGGGTPSTTTWKLWRVI